MTALPVIATIVDVGLAVVLVAVSGVVFEGPEGMNGDPAAMAGWIAMAPACVGAPMVFRAAGLWQAGTRAPGRGTSAARK